MTTRIGLIGAGYWGDKLARIFASLPGASLRIAADVDPERRRRFDDRVVVSADPEAVWSHPEVDAVVIATPPSLHYELARQALLAGKHCWVEKPLALRTRDAAALVGLAREHDRVLFVDETFLYDPLVRRAREWIRDGLLGSLCHLSFERLGMGRVRRDSDVWWNSASHDLSILCYLVPAEATNVRLERFSYLQPGVADMCVATLALAGGVSVHLYLSWLSPVKTASLVVVGSRGMLVYEGRFEKRVLTRYEYALRDPHTTRTNVVPIENFTVRETVPGGEEEPLALAAAGFLECLRNGTHAPSEGIYSLKVVELLERGHESAGTR